MVFRFLPAAAPNEPGATTADGTTLAPLRGGSDRWRPLYSTATETPVVPAVIPASGLAMGEKMEELLVFRMPRRDERTRTPPRSSSDDVSPVS